MKLILNLFQKKLQNATDVVEKDAQNLINNDSNDPIQLSNNLKNTRKYGIIYGILNGLFYGGLFACLFIGIGIIFTFVNNCISKGEFGRSDLFRIVISTILGTVMLVKTKNNFGAINESCKIGARLFKIIDIQHINQSYYDRDSTIIEVSNNSTKSRAELSTGQNVPLKRYFSYNKTNILAIIIGIIGSIINGGILPCISLIITSIFGASNDSNSILKYLSLIGGVNFIGYCLQFIGYSVAGEKFTYTLRKKLYDTINRNKNKSMDLASNEGTESFLSIFNKAGLAQGISRNIGFIFEALTALIVGLTIDFLNKWTVALVILGIIVLVATMIIIKKSRQSNTNSESAIPSHNTKTICVNSFIDAVKTSMPYLLISLIIFLCFTAVRTEYMEFKNVIKMLIATVLTFVGILRAKMNIPNMTEAKKAFNNVIQFIDNKINSFIPQENLV